MQPRNLRDRLARLAHTKPSVRAAVLPVLRQAAGDTWGNSSMRRTANEVVLTTKALAEAGGPQLFGAAGLLVDDKVKVDLVTGSISTLSGMQLGNVTDRSALRYMQRAFGRFASMRRTAAGKPYLEGEGLNAKAVKDNMAFMVFSIIPPGDPRAKGPRGHSKFYEVLIKKDGGGYTLVRLWGALGSGPHSRSEQTYTKLEDAQRSMSQHYRKRMGDKSKGYVNAFGDNRKFQTIDPKTGRTVTKTSPYGQYPISFRAESPGFGHPVQQETHCIPALRALVTQLDEAQDLISGTGEAGPALQGQLEEALNTINAIAPADTSMAGKLRKDLGAVIRRVQGGPRFREDPGGSKLMAALYSIRNYIVRSTGYCTPQEEAAEATARVASLYMRRRAGYMNPANPATDMATYVEDMVAGFLRPYPAIWNTLGVDKNDVQVDGRVMGGSKGIITIKSPAAGADIRIAINARGTHRVTGTARGVKLGADFEYRASDPGMHRGTQGEISSYISDVMPAKVVYQVVGHGTPQTFDTKEALLRQYRSTGVETSTRLRQELQGQPKLEGLTGPMWGGRKGDTVTVRYETWETYEALSR